MLIGKVARTLSFVVVSLGTIWAGGSGQAGPIGGFDRTCQYFTNMAFQDRRASTDTTFRMQLAQDCVDALIYSQSPVSLQRDRATDYLAQLEAYRQTIVGMLVSRAEGRGAERRVMSSIRPAVEPVSRAGAYLIARDMGLVDSHIDWTAWRRSASLPLFRLDEVSRN